VPVLSTPQTDPIVLTREYSLGRIVPDGDAAELAAAIEASLAEQLRIPSERRLAFIERYAWEAQAESLLNLYDRIL
jgi:glycosyltransferase involved in cell wall biosynthesis